MRNCGNVSSTRAAVSRQYTTNVTTTTKSSRLSNAFIIINPMPPPPPKPPPSPAAKPLATSTSSRAPEPVIHGGRFDAWNSSSTGHQRAENRLGASVGWRDSRNAKLGAQFRGGASGGRGRVSDRVGAGSEHWDPAARALVTPEARARARHSVADMLARPGTMKSVAVSRPSSSGVPPVGPGPGLEEAGSRDAGVSKAEEQLVGPREAEDTRDETEEERPPLRPPTRRIFDGVVVYVNGSTHPTISDHRLKQVLAEHGARLSVHFGRRHVTHVILGRSVGGGSSHGGAGGGLAATKLQREARRAGGGSGGGAVKFVGVEWVLESVKAGRRLAETRFGNPKVVAPGRQQSVLGMCSNSPPPPLQRSGSSA